MTTKYPQPIYSTEPGSWAQSTVIDRWPEIVNRVINENEFLPQVLEQLIQLRDGIPEGPIRQLQDPGAPDIKYWESYIKSPGFLLNIIFTGGFWRLWIILTLGWIRMDTRKNKV
jgi:hypothetical protein